jgi:hypothetical protein
MMEQLFTDLEPAQERKRPGILEFYELVKHNGLCLKTLRFDGAVKEEHRVYCFRPVSLAWMLWCESEGHWYACCATCENHNEYNIVGIRDRKMHPEDPHNHAIAIPYPYQGDWTHENLVSLTEEWRKTHV